MADYTEAEAKAAWEAIQPEPDTILWYHQWFVDPTNSPGEPTTPDTPDFYRKLMLAMQNYADEQTNFGDDDAWLSHCRDMYTECLDEDTEVEHLKAMQPYVNGDLPWPAQG